MDNHSPRNDSKDGTCRSEAVRGNFDNGMKEISFPISCQQC